ncbi:Aliphatic sulfonates import ATP-binding protein SsuB [compost metagenome]
MLLSNNNHGLDVQGVSVSYAGGELALGKMDLHVPEHNIYTLLGPSGCGKSTLLRAIAGLISNYQGQIVFNHKSLKDKDHPLIGLVPQNYGLLPWKTVQANIMTAMKISHGDLSKDVQLARTKAWLTAMGIDNLASKYPLAISGGQQQRVAIARAFAIQPEIMLLDEPFSALDAITREDIQRIFLENWRENPTTTLFVTHDVDEAILLGQKIVVMPSRKDETSILIDNPVFHVEHSQKREHPQFFEQTKVIRKVMQEKW